MWLDNLRAKSKNQREQYAFLGAASISLVIAVFWLISVSVELNSPSPTLVTEPTVEPASAFGEFFSEATDQVGSIIATMGAGVEDASKASLEATSTEPTDEQNAAIVVPETNFRFPEENELVAPLEPDETIIIETKPTGSVIQIATSTTSQ